MAIDQVEVGKVAHLLWPHEGAELTVKQKRVGPGGAPINPTSVICTNERIIIINRSALGLRKDYEIITYAKVVHVRLERGIFSSSVILRLFGGDTGRGFLTTEREEGEVNGLRFRDAKMVRSTEKGEKGIYQYCPRCGARNPKGAESCANCGIPLE